MQIVHGAVSSGRFAGRLPSTGCRDLSYGALRWIIRRNFPSASNTWIRRLPRSATYTLFCRSTPMLCGVLNCPAFSSACAPPLPRDPHDLIQFPRLSNLAIREFV